MTVLNEADDTELRFEKSSSFTTTDHDVNQNILNPLDRGSTESERCEKRYKSSNCATLNLCNNHTVFSSTPHSTLPSTNIENDAVFFSTSYYDELHTTVGLCRDFVVSRLKRSGFGYKVYVTTYAPSKDQQLSQSIMHAGQIFEGLQPRLLHGLSWKIGYVFDSEETIKRLYYRLSTHIMGVDCHNYTWSRILALFCLAGAVAVDCASQGHPELVETVVKVSSSFIKQNVLEWVIKKGGWVTMAEHFTKTRSSNRRLWFDFAFKDSAMSATTFAILGLSLLGFLGIDWLV